MKIPRKLGATSGQGVSRLGYQAARSLGANGTGMAGTRPLKNIPGLGVGTSPTPKNYAKDSTPQKLFDAISQKGYGVYDTTAMRNPNLGALKRYPNA